MVQLDLQVNGMNAAQIESWIQSSLFDIHPDSIVKLKVHGKVSTEALAALRAPALRALAPETMNIDVTLVDYAHYRNRHSKPRP
jgi:hypothetical protein